jgi:NAD(P)-dependent dehydrogenase (short-subunit alcohol dehydrogenase family)
LPLDVSRTNSWKLEADDVHPAELAEVIVVNTIAPFLLTTGLSALLRRSPHPDRYVVHASAVEGQFEAPRKTTRHPHTNMAKAALNMFTRTSAAFYAKEGIYMTSVDTGWVTNENPQLERDAQRARGFRLPLDIEDGAARLYDPIVQGVRGTRLFGVLLKDYVPAPW